MDRAKHWQIITIMALVMLVCFPAYSHSAPVTLDATTRGPHPPGGFFSSRPTADNSYVVGYVGIAEFRNFFLFDLAGLSGTVNAATLLLTNPPAGFNSVDGLEQYTIFDVTSDFALLGAANPSATF